MSYIPPQLDPEHSSRTTTATTTTAAAAAAVGAAHIIAMPAKSPIPMVQARQGMHGKVTAQCAFLQRRDPIKDTTHPGMHQSHGAHDAGFVS